MASNDTNSQRYEMKGPTPIDLSSLKPSSGDDKPPSLDNIQEAVKEAVSPRTRLRMRIKYSQNKRARKREVNKKS